jgi:hypothetical protein
LISSDTQYDKNRRYIFSLKKSISSLTNNKWRITYDKVQKNYLISNHDFTNEFLYLDNYLDKTQTLNVFLSSNKDNLEAYDLRANKWMIIPQNDGYFYIKNLFKEQYLYEFYYDFDTKNGYQYVFVSKSKFEWTKQNNDKRKWIIS